MRSGPIVVAALVSALLAGCAGAPASGSTVGAASPVQEASVAALPRNVGVFEAAALRDAGAFVLDVREPYEWAEFHIPGATLIPLGTLGDRLSEVPRDKPIVVVCRSGNRSQTGRDILLRAGFAAVTSMDGGVRAWRDAGLPVTR